MVSKSMVEAVLTWLEHTHAIGFTRDEISNLADEYLEVQSVTVPKVEHSLQATSTSMMGSALGYCTCGFKGVLAGVQRHITDANEPVHRSTYLPPDTDEHVMRGDSVGMGRHERWYCSCGQVFEHRALANNHLDYALRGF